ncbi:MAG TPA: hypothetical protein VH640_08395 [Bryobacteraceae bacterium]
MTVDYKIRIENGGVTITQHVDGAASSGRTPSRAVAGNLTILGTSFAGSKAAKQGSGDPGSLIGSGDPGSLIGGGDPGSLIGGGDPGSLIGGGDPGSLIGGGDPASGQIAIFGPIVIDACGLVHTHLAGQTPQQKEEK